MRPATLLAATAIGCSLLMGSCFPTADKSEKSDETVYSDSIGLSTAAIDSLRAELTAIADSADGLVGIAAILPGGDTLTVNNTDCFQLMSVFKLHQALAVGHTLDLQDRTFDTIVIIDRRTLDPATWSPMMAVHRESTIRLSIDSLLRYTLQQSDNNASNLMFDSIVSVADCDAFLRRATGITDFSLSIREHDMKLCNASADSNHSSPLACARLIEKVFTDSLISPAKQQAIQQMLFDCLTGIDRIAAGLGKNTTARLAHKTGSGFRRPNGRLSAHNDVGYILLPDGRAYSLAVLVRDFNGDEAQASAVISRISAAVYRAIESEGVNRNDNLSAVDS